MLRQDAPCSLVYSIGLLAECLYGLARVVDEEKVKEVGIKHYGQ